MGRNALRFPVAALALTCFLGGAPRPASAKDAAQAATEAEIANLQKMRIFQDPVPSSPELTPFPFTSDPFSQFDIDPTGYVETYQPVPLSTTSAFFQDLGTNGRTCATCHQADQGWTRSAVSVSAEFTASQGLDPIFRRNDGAVCPSAAVSSLADRVLAYQLLTSKALIRVGMALPDPAKGGPPLEFEVTKVVDPYHCTTGATGPFNSVTGLTDKTHGFVSMYRRPLPSTNLGFLSTIMWDGREPTLEHQSNDATRGHAQADHDLTTTPVDQRKEIVDFETGLFTAQVFDNDAGDLTAVTAAGTANGGPFALSQQFFYLGINDPFGHDLPGAPPFNPKNFDLYKPFETPVAGGGGGGGHGGGGGGQTQALQRVAHGEKLFNTAPINITGVTGLNDDLNRPSMSGTCSTCHDTPNVGNHSVKEFQNFLDIGISDAGAKSPPSLNILGLPVFTLTCKAAGPLFGKIYQVTDPGLALITGRCADIGKLKVPILRGLAARAPYFHNGSAATLDDVVQFYRKRFGLNLLGQDLRDLVMFLRTL